MGSLLSKDEGYWPIIKGFFPPKSNFSVDQIPDLSGKVMIVTGGYVGIGYETVKALLEHNAKVYIAVRSKAKAEDAIKKLKELTGREAIFLELDLANLNSVKKSVAEFLSKESSLHVLFNNAGVMWAPKEMLTEQGYDLQWGTNVVGHFLFTDLLMPALIAGVETSGDHHARVVTTASSAAYVGTIDFDTFKDSAARKKLSPMDLYHQSKIGNVIMARQFAKRYADKGIVSTSCDPGNINTNLARHASAFEQWFLRKLVRPTPDGALTQLFCGTMPEALNYNGEFLIPFARLGRCKSEAYDEKLGDKVWQWLQEETAPFRL